VLPPIAGEGVRQMDADRPQMGVHAALTRAAAQLVAISLVCAASVAHAQTSGSDQGTVWDGFMRTIGLENSPEDDFVINYTERSPLVVPPTRDLARPGSEAAAPVPDWPVDPARRSKRTKSKTAVVPNTAVPTPNPPHVRAPWYNPMGWFDKEEYANFTGEPVRRSLTDPPAGYRVPSPDQPYGLSPDDKSQTQAKAQDFPYGSVTPPAGGSGH